MKYKKVKHKGMSKNVNHARTDEKRKQLRLKNFHTRVMENRSKKIIKSHKVKGVPFVGRLGKYERYFLDWGGISRIRQLRKKPQTQSKIRKLARQMQRKVA